MGESGSVTKGKRSRGQYMVDRRLQVTVTLQILGALALIAVLYVIGIHVLPGEDAKENLSADETRSFFLRATLIYFLMAAAIVSTLTLLVTHRIAGPAAVMRKALQAMVNGNYETRLSLRRWDYLKSLAGAVRELRDVLQERDDKHKQLLRDLDACLRENDHSAAREVLVQLGLGEEAGHYVDASSSLSE